MKFFKVSLFSSLITIIKVLSGFVVSKFVALFVGPSGVALLGQFTNFSTIVFSLSNGSIGTGVVKYTAEYQEDDVETKKLFSTAFRISLYCSVFIGLVIVLFCQSLSKIVLFNDSYYSVFIIFGLAIVFFSLNTLFSSILNGQSDIKYFSSINIITTIVNVIISVILVKYFKLYGALISVCIIHFFTFFYSLFVLRNQKWFSLSNFKGEINKKYLGKLSGFSLIAITGAICVPLSQMFVRDLIVSQIDLQSAGYWQGMMRVSDGYLMIIVTSLNLYYLPKLSSLKTDLDLAKEVIFAFKVYIPITIFGCICIYFLRFFIIDVLYTKEFYSMEDLFFYQLLGDIMKVASCIIGYLLVAKAMTKTAVFTESFFALMLYILSFLLIKYRGLNGVTFAFFINYVIYFIILLFIFRSTIFTIWELIFKTDKK
ncbi:O-antigen translocase [Flavobacterium weaverense]|uniref:PST family polysaccharide transporter n=1 Tax=Flavobacterium weaverense TaxID=271156 RepID=A0A3L9ZRC7_9FLAO|nr:O-antigen translocase [Flavobacterium weaverense]RMA74834.1 PST family polysaccharide transporter [Flavobacterium weaverense]